MSLGDRWKRITVPFIEAYAEVGHKMHVPAQQDLITMVDGIAAVPGQEQASSQLYSAVERMLRDDRGSHRNAWFCIFSIWIWRYRRLQTLLTGKPLPNLLVSLAHPPGVLERALQGGH